jgi:precorrin-4 methylase
MEAWAAPAEKIPKKMVEEEMATKTVQKGKAKKSSSYTVSYKESVKALQGVETNLKAIKDKVKNKTAVATDLKVIGKCMAICRRMSKIYQ